MWDIIKSSTPEILWAGIKYTIPVAIISFAIGLVLAVITALIRISRPQGKSKPLWGGVRAVFSFYVWLFRSTPLLVQLFIVFFGLPNVGIQFDAWTAGIITFSLNTGPTPLKQFGALFYRFRKASGMLPTPLG